MMDAEGGQRAIRGKFLFRAPIAPSLELSNLWHDRYDTAPLLQANCKRMLFGLPSLDLSGLCYDTYGVVPSAYQDNTPDMVFVEERLNGHIAA